MGESSIGVVRRSRGGRVVVATVSAIVCGTLASSTAGAANRVAITATTSSTDGVVLLALGAGVLVLGGIGFVLFTWSKRKRQPVQCADERDALEVAERAVRYWEAARDHLEMVARERSATATAADDSAHASLVTKAVEGLNSAVRQRDQCQLDLIHCMATGAPATPTKTQAPVPLQPFFTPSTDQTPSTETQFPA
jgi:hypothetical protein